MAERNVSLHLGGGFFAAMLWVALFATGRCYPCNTDYDYLRGAEASDGEDE